MARALEKAEARLVEAPPAGAAEAKATEWFLDNAYLLHRAARQIADELPRSFEERLPRLPSGPERGLTRVDSLARALIAEAGHDLDQGGLLAFVGAYQSVQVLTIAELWALPIMLRAAVLRGVMRSLASLGVAAAPADGEGPLSGIEHAVRALRLFGEIDWKAVFEAASRVEAVLRDDPSGTYPGMDFATCDAYRKVVEEIAWRTGRAEEDVARAAVALAESAGAASMGNRQAHVGYYLLGEGRRQLEKQTGYRPAGLERVRRALRAFPTLGYLGSLGLSTAAPLSLVAGYARANGASGWRLAASVALAFVPATVVATAAVRSAMARLLRPAVLPKMDFSDAIPDDARTLVVVPALLGSPGDIDPLVRRLELHYLAGPDPQLSFALLTDEVDRTGPHPDLALIDAASRAIEALNEKHGAGGKGPFHLLHREARWNPAEGRHMGWERKRGKLEELNRLLRGDQRTSYTRHVGDPRGLERIRFVLTLDSDTELPLGAAKKLIGLLSHPLNRPVLGQGGRLEAGYSIVQPRVEVSASSAVERRFSRLFSGDVGFDIYSHAVSDTYQDLFGAGIYVGKGLYDVDAFSRTLEGRVPENAVVSHDLLEGIHGRAALATDIVVLEDYPAHYVAFLRRTHRWVRGDWQLLPWLLPWVPASGRKWRRNDLSLIDRFKIADNVRRSLVSPSLFALLLSGLTFLPGRPPVWALVVLGALLAPVLPALGPDARKNEAALGRFGLGVAFLACETALVADAVARALVRMLITRRRLLEWVCAAHTASEVGRGSPRALLWRELAASPLIAGLSLPLLAWAGPSSLLAGAPFLALWLAAPEIARWVSERPAPRRETMSAADRLAFRLIARRTWLFFETFVGPTDQWLPIDNHQEHPHPQTAHRTSPTNIGMLLLSTLTAFDLGWLGPTELAVRVGNTLDAIARLARYRGHLLNWYDTRTLEPLLPQYVSTVDSGNLAGCFIALREGCGEVALAEVVGERAWEGLADTLQLFVEACSEVGEGATAGIDQVAARMTRAIARGRAEPGQAHASLACLCDELSPELDRALYALVASGALRHEPDRLHALRTWLGRVHHQMTEMRRELTALLPWVAWGDDPVAHALSLPASLSLGAVPAACQRLESDLDAWASGRPSPGPAIEASVARAREALRGASAHARSLLDRLEAIARRCDAEVEAMRFGFLYDPERKLFRIGFNVTLDRNDPHHYDLLASEARLASYLAIVRREVPEEHWHTLGRPMARVAGATVLVSWGGSMFEYLMPSLLMRSHQGTLLAESCEAAVRAHIAWGASNGAPWGVSESSYARVDAHHTYQYRSFGVPGLGFKRGLEEDHVVAPYASMLAAGIVPRAVLDNSVKLKRAGMQGTYGHFEALDLTPARSSGDDRGTVVRSYMAHHQGMLLVALGNALGGDPMLRRFHADPRVESGEALLNERAPFAPPLEKAAAAASKEPPAPLAPAVAPAPWSPAEGPLPAAHVLGNGRLTSLLTDAGGGGLRWRGLALTGFRPDPTEGRDGLFVFVRDEGSGRVFLATSASGQTTFSAHQVEYLRRVDGLSVHVDVTVAAADDVDIRLVTLHNETDQPRRLTVTSAAEPVLLPVAGAMRHPAFAKLFLESSDVAELDGVLFARRPRSADDPRAVLVHRLVHEGPEVSFAGTEHDRAVFYGRCGDPRAPAGLGVKRPDRPVSGPTIDPVMSVAALVELPAHGSVSLAFVTAVARSGTEATEIARRYGSMHAVRWAFHDAAPEAARRLRRAFVEPGDLPCVARLFSALLFADPALRASPDVLASGKPSQSALWGRGISGDDPILLVRVHDEEAPLVRQVLAAQSYLRACGVPFDLVLVDDQATGYLTQASGTLGALLTQLGVLDWVNRRGGIFVIPRDQIDEAERRRLEATARALGDTRDGTLLSWLSRPAARPPELPAFQPSRDDDAPPGVPPCPPLLFDAGPGGFTDDGREYVIRVRPGAPLPAPWCNVLANAEAGCLVSESSLGSTWSINAGENRLTPWRNDPVFDTPSEALYLRDEETASFWSPTPLPSGNDAETLVRHGAGYTSYSRASHGLEQELTVFVPPGAPFKVARLRLRNTLARHRRLTATYYAEWVLGSSREDLWPYVVPELARGQGCLLATGGFGGERGQRVAFLASARDIHGVTADRLEFLGRGGDMARPAALGRWGLSGRVEAGADPCAALQVHLELEPGGSLETHFLLGEAESREAALEAVERHRDPDAIDEAWKALERHWDRTLGAVRVATPDRAMDVMLNRWLLYQSLSSRFFGRTGFYQSSGAYGFRDQLQDVLAYLHAAPELARAHLVESARHQFEEGDVLHWWHPPGGRGVRTRCSDDLAWLPFVLAEYVEATGDETVLGEQAPFLSAPPLRDDEHDRYAGFDVTAHTAPLFDHARRALDRALTEGPHRLPKMGDGDWNDGMNRVGAAGRGESVWLGWFLVATMTRFARLCERKGLSDEAGRWRAKADELGARVDEVAWDGAWYVRAFHDDGSLLGSEGSRECRIDSIAQSWSVLSGPGDRARRRRALESADRHLVLEGERLVLLLTPPFQTPLHDPGYIRAYPPGVRENGGQYTHAATWLGWAHAEIGDGDGAERIFRLLNPVLRATTPAEVDRYRVEPYVLAGDVYGSEPWVGRGGWTWYTGAASWAWRLGVEAILGLRLDGGDLRLAPCIPRSWPRFEAWVRRGSQTVHVVVENPDGVSTGIAQMTVDGAEVEPPRVRLEKGKTGVREVRVRLGAPARGGSGPPQAPA